MNFRSLSVLLSLALAACAQVPAPPGRLSAPASPAPWAFARSDLRVDPAWRFGRLANGMRYIIRHNDHPAGTVLMRMQVDAGSLDEREDERGYAHFVEHMAFQGSTHVPAGEMVHLLERLGLAFGADTNAATGFERTTYMLDLPRNDPALVDKALMLMRETASELRFDPDRLVHERGVVLAEMRDRNSFGYREYVDGLGFAAPTARFGRRLPIGTTEALDVATSARLRAFWAREYVPAKTTVIVIGDIDPAAAEAAITAHFADWPAAPSPPQPSPGPVAVKDGGRTHIYLDPAVAERVTISRHEAWHLEPDTQAQRRTDLLQRIGYAIIDRRLQRLSRQTPPPFHDAAFGTGDIFKVGRATSLVVDTVDGGWRAGVTAAALAWRRALKAGFTPAELAEQLADLRQEAEHAAAGAATQTNRALLADAFALLNDDMVATAPADDLARFNAFAPAITPAAVLRALRRDAAPLAHPLIRLQGRRAPVGAGGGTALAAGEAALRGAWEAAMRAPLPPVDPRSATAFAYTDFGPRGTVVADSREPLLGIREVRFANGVRLNLRHTDLDQDRVLVALALDGGGMLNTRANPLAVAMMSAFAAGGLGKHSQDDLQTLLAGHAVSAGWAANPQTFNSAAATTPADLGLELQLLAAYVTDPGYRPEGEVQYRTQMNNAFAAMHASAAGMLAATQGGILSDNDPRFTLAPVEAYRALSFAKLRGDLTDRLAHGAIEIGLVGDLDEDRTIALVARSFGALPAREADFLPYADQRRRPFTQDHAPRIVTHLGPADQALVRTVWHTRDDNDPDAKQVLNMLARVVQEGLTESLRQRLGKAYSPTTVSAPTREWVDYGTFAITASVDVRDIAATRAAISATVAQLRDAPPGDDVMLRARAPLLQSFANDFKINAGWMNVVARAQSEADRLERELRAQGRLLAVTAAQVQAAAKLYLTPQAAVEVIVRPPGDTPSAAAPAALGAGARIDNNSAPGDGPGAR